MNRHKPWRSTAMRSFVARFTPDELQAHCRLRGIMAKDPESSWRTKKDMTGKPILSRTLEALERSEKSNTGGGSNAPGSPSTGNGHNIMGK